jgi:hypothetical protein
MSHVVCPLCQEGFLRVVAQVGIEAEGSTVKFQQLKERFTDVIVGVRNL